MNLQLFGKYNKTENNKSFTDAKHQFQFSYSIIPTNFANLSETNQAEKLGKFFDILRVIQDKIKITLSRRDIVTIVEGHQVVMPVIQVHLESYEPLGDMLERLKFEYIDNSRPPYHKIIREHLNKLEIQTIHDFEEYLVDSINSAETTIEYAKCFTLYAVPSTLPYAWIHNIFSICAEVQIWIRPIPHDESITKLTRYKDLIYEDSKNNRETASKYKRADDLMISLRRKETGLYKCVINCMVTETDKKLLNDSARQFKKNIKLHGGSFADVSASHF